MNHILIFPRHISTSKVQFTSGYITTYSSGLDEQFPQWCPDVNYYLGLIYNLVQVIDGVGQEPEFDPIGFDWRFHEFTNPVHLTLYSMCIELMTLAVPPPDVGRYLFEIVTNPQSPVESKSLPKVITHYES